MARYGFLGMGIMGRAIAANLVKGGFEVVVWNRTPERCAPLVALGARQGTDPRSVVAECDATFAMLSSPAAVEDLFFAEGALDGVGPGHDVVDMSTVDDSTSRRLDEAVRERGGRFLEAPVSGSRQPAESGELVILAAGDESLAQDLAPALDRIGKLTVFLGEAGQASRMKLAVNAVMGGMFVALCEGLALADKCGLRGEQVLQVLDAGAMANPMFRAKGPMLLAGEYAPSFPLKHMQKDLRLTAALGEEVGQALYATAVVNETFKRARIEGHGDQDFSAVFEVVR